jgi:hypothetical protein
MKMQEYMPPLALIQRLVRSVPPHCPPRRSGNKRPRHVVRKHAESNAVTLFANARRQKIKFIEAQSLSSSVYVVAIRLRVSVR